MLFRFDHQTPRMASLEHDSVIDSSDQRFPSWSMGSINCRPGFRFRPVRWWTSRLRRRRYRESRCESVDDPLPTALHRRLNVDQRATTTFDAAALIEPSSPYPRRRAPVVLGNAESPAGASASASSLLRPPLRACVAMLLFAAHVEMVSRTGRLRAMIGTSQTSPMRRCLHVCLAAAAAAAHPLTGRNRCQFSPF